MALSTHRASASLLSSESPPRWKYDVFLSFRGADTRKGFVSHLYHELQRHGITTFFDDRELEGGASIPLGLPCAIKESHTAVVVLSPNYASSKWCLDELTNIVQCMKATNSILPVFYGVNPSDVGNQRGSFAEAFAEHDKKLISTEDKTKVIQWKADLKLVSKLYGWHLRNFKCERELIEDIVKCVWRKVQAPFTISDCSQRLVGTDSALEQLSLLLAHDANEVHFIGITGMGGLGKTTLAKLTFDNLFHHFEVHCFLANVREVCARDHTLVGLQKKLLFPILREKIAEIWDEGCGSIFTKKCLCNKKVLLVLDDVDQLNQLEVLAGNRGWFGMGSRIIITTRNERLLVQHGISTLYKMQGLNYGEALELFSLNAFRKEQPEEDFWELSEHFLKYAKGLPLALKTLGSFLYTRDQDSWKSELDNLHKISKPTIFNSLKISYDGLEEMEKRIFLDVACFHKGKCITEVIRILDSSFGISSCIMLYMLIERSLVDKDYKNRIGMHDLIQEMAWTIVGQESEDHGLRSRLWHPNDIFHVFMSNTGTRAIEAISLRLPQPKIEEVRQWNCETFSKMHGLRFLEFDNLIISSCPKFLPCSLRVMHWSWYPSKFLPTSFHPCFLTELKMPSSKIVRLWEGKKDLPNLKYIDLTFSYKLMSTPDFSGLPNLEKLYLWGCKNLVEIHPSIAVLKRLKVLCLHGCERIKRLPSKVEIDSLESFDLSYCSNVKKIPDFGEQMKNLSQLYVVGTAIETIPSSIEHLVGLAELDLRSCKNLLNLPSSICNLKSLRCLNVNRCSKLDRFPGDMEYLKTLYLGITMREPLVGMKNLEYLEVDGAESNARSRERWGLLRLLGLGKSRPDPPCWGLLLSSLSGLCSLIELDLRDCNLCEGDIPDDIGCLSVLKKLYISGNNFVSLPESIRSLSKLQRLRLERCKSLQVLPHLPSNIKLHVDADNCTSLKRLCDPSKLSSCFANLYDFTFSSVNCITLVQDEGWINTILSRILKFAAEGPCPSYDKKFTQIVSPGSEIPEWFSNQSVGHSVNVELPPPSCNNWMGIAFCVVFEDPKQNLANSAALICPYTLRQYDEFQIGVLPCFPNVTSQRCKVGSLVSEHLWVFYLPSKLCQAEQISFTTFYDYEREPGLNVVKKCGACLVYEQDLEELTRTLKILKRTHEYCDEAAPSGLESGSFDHIEQIHKRQKQG